MIETDFKDSPAEGPAPVASTSATDYEANIPEERRNLVKAWLTKIKKAKDRRKEDFKRMEWCTQIAGEGAEEDWIKAEKYVVPIVVRHINQAVAQLYAKDPRAVAKRRRRLLYQIWDGRPESYQIALQKATPPQPIPSPTPGGPPVPPPAGPMGEPLDPGTGQPWMPDPNAVALLQDIQQALEYTQMVDRLGKSMEILWGYFASEQANGFKTQMKAAVRRTKVCGVSYVKLCFQRALKKNPEIGAQIDDTTSKIARLEALASKQGAQAPQVLGQQPATPGEQTVVDTMAVGSGYGGQTEPMEAGSPDIEELRLLLKDLQTKETVIAREGPVFDFPRADEIIPDLKCRHLKTFMGCEWVAHKFEMTPEEVLETYKVDIKGKYTEYYKDSDDKSGRMATYMSGKGDDRQSLVCIYEVQHKKNGQFLTVAEGYCDFLREPAEPDVKIERFWTLFPIVFNEIEHKDKIYPPSDVWLARHTQKEYNRSREGLREHRIAARPKYASALGALQREDKKSLASAAPHEVIEMKGLKPGQDVKQLIQQFPAATIDMNLYEVNQFFQDLQRTVGSQEANLGGTSEASATESSIAENSRSASLSDNVDDLDDMLTELAKATGQLMLMELAKDTVILIVGPGATWPDIQGNREEIAKDLFLEIKAGSSGRPNRAAELANMERGMPYLLQLPGINPMPVGKKYLQLLEMDDDLEEAIVEGLPSISALNAMASKSATLAPGQETGNPATSPNAQGPAGAQNAPGPQQNENEPGGQPAYPTPT